MNLLAGCKRAVLWWISFTKETIDAIKKAKNDKLKG